MTDTAQVRGGAGIDIGTIYALAYLALALVLVSLIGNVLASFSQQAQIGGFSTANYADLLSDPRLADVMLRTLVFGAGAVAVMMVFAFPIAWIISRTDFPWKKVAIGMLVAKLAIPGFITAMSYIWLFNPTSGLINHMLGATQLGATPVFDIYGLSWICFIQGIVLVPACVFLMLPAFQNLDGTLEEAAWVSGITRRTAIRHVVLPLLAPGILGAMFFFFVVAVESFDIVGLIGLPGRIRVLSIWIYDALHPSVGLPDYGFAGAIGMLLFVISGVAIAFYVRLLRRSERFAVVGGKGRAAQLQVLGTWKWVAGGFILIWAIAAFFLPLVTLGWVSLIPYLQPPSMAAFANLSVQSFGHALSYLHDAAINTFVVGVGAVIMVLTWSLSICWVVTRSRSRSAAWVDTIVFLSPAVPSMVAAVAFQYLGIALYKWLPLYGTIWLVAIVMGTRMLAFCTRTMNAASWQIHAQLDEAAYVSGVSKFGTFRYVFLPILAPAVFYSAVIVALLSMRELTVPLMINTGHAPLISTLVFDLQMSGSHNVAAAISIYMIVFLVAVTFLAGRLTRMDKPLHERVRRRRPRLQAKPQPSGPLIDVGQQSYSGSR